MEILFKKFLLLVPELLEGLPSTAKKPSDRLAFCYQNINHLTEMIHAVGLYQRSKDNTLCGCWLACASIAVAAC